MAARELAICPRCEGLGDDPSMVDIACCGRTRPDGDCCGEGIPEPSACRECGGGGVIARPPDERGDASSVFTV